MPRPKSPASGPAPADWRSAQVRDPEPCVACGQPAILRHPVTRRPHHKVCADRLAQSHIERSVSAAEQRAANNLTTTEGF